MKRVLVITGPPGVGKTTTAKKLGLPIVHTDDYIRGRTWSEIPEAINEAVHEALREHDTIVLEGFQAARWWRKLPRLQGNYGTISGHCLCIIPQRSPLAGSRSAKLQNQVVKWVLGQTALTYPKSALRRAQQRLRAWGVVP